MAFDLNQVYEWFTKSFGRRRTHIEMQNKGLVEDIIQRLNLCEERHDKEAEARQKETEARQHLETRAARLEETIARMDAERAVAVIECDENLRIIAWNQGAQKLFRWTAEQAIGQHITAIFPPRYWRRSKELLAQPEAEDSSLFGINREGDTMALRMRAHSFTQEDGKPRTALEISLKRI